jgi:two-component system chemotaxis sensor kinase CheA
MDRDSLIRRLMATFLGELEEHVRTLNHDLLALEKAPHGPDRAELLKTLFRASHSLKGAAHAVTLDPVEAACHRMEEILSMARDGRSPLDAEQIGLLLALTDAIEEAGMRLREQSDLSGSPLVALLARLQAAEAAPAEAAPASPAPPPAGTDRPAEGPEAGSLPPDPGDGSTPPNGQGAETLPPARPIPSAVAATPVEPGPSASGPPKPAPALCVPAASEPSVGVAAPKPAAEHAVGGQGFVRIPAEKLDVLLTRSSELLVARLRMDSRVEDLVTLREFVGRWNGQWRSAKERLRKFLPRNGQSGGEGLLPRREAHLLAQVGENLTWLERELEHTATALDADQHQIDGAAGRLDEEVRHARMLPFAEACQGLERVVRDLARTTGKAVELVIQGGDVELDRSILEGLKDPLGHLVRNAVDHGIEPPEQRRQAGKPPKGRVTVSAALRGSQVEVVIADDGRGLNLDALRQKARQRGLTGPLGERELADLIFLPGLSTAPIITNISGRGVGMDVVKSRLEELRGAIDLVAQPGRGMRLTLSVPLTLTVLRALLVTVGGRVYALASTNVVTLVRVATSDLRAVGGREMLMLGGAPVPVSSLAETLGLRGPAPLRAGGKRLIVVMVAGEKRLAFVVEELLAEQEIVVKSLGPRLRRVPHVSGATILPSGKVALVLNAASLIRSALARTPGLAPSPTMTALAGSAARKRLLVADDSVTTRTLEKGILEAAGFEVATAVDGEDAWRRLQEQGADLLISDVEMPRMDGFSLTQTIRGSSQFRDLPIVLLTSLGSEQDRARGIEVGADAYIVKGGFDQQDLIETIRQLL